MHLHQILTGAANPSDYSYAAGSIDSVHFVAYAAGYNIVILSGDFQRVQVLLSGNETNQSLLTCIDCTTHTGKIVAGFGNQVCIYEAAATSERSLHHQVNFRWSLTHTITCSNEKINAVAWHPKGEQLIVVCKSTLQVWSYRTDEIESSLNRVNFALDVNENADKQIGHSNQRTWKNIWSYNPATPIKHVAYSNGGAYFATVSQNDRLVKVWYRSSDSSAMISFTSIYLPHPRAVTYISWRKTSRYFAEGTVVNCLLTCCKDNICRIWSETRQPDESSVYIADLTANTNQKKKQSDCLNRSVQKLFKIKSNYLNIQHNHSDLPSPSSSVDNQYANIGTPLRSSTLQNIHEDDAISNSNVASNHSGTLPPSRSSSSSSLPFSHSTSSTPYFVRFHLATTIDPNGASLKPQNIPSFQNTAFIVQWMNNKDFYNSFSIEQYLQNLQRRNNKSSHPISTSDTEEPLTTIENPVDSLNGQEKRLPLTNNRNHLSDESKYFLQTRHFFRKLIEEWKHSADVVFSIHPVDGSLLLWVIDCLDHSTRAPPVSWSPSNSSSALLNYQMLQRQVQVSFSARLPDIFPLGDAISLQPHLLIYCHEILFNQILSLNQNKLHEHLPTINMITKHTNGTLNLWSLTFNEQQKFQSLICVTHAARMCGHNFPIRHIICHPIVPLVLTSSFYEEPHETHHGSKQRFENSLILWSTEPIGPLTVNDGITELARMKSPRSQAFRLIAWFPMVMPCMNIDLLRESPSVLFCASDGEYLRIYQVICNAKTLLASQFTTSKSHGSLSDNDQRLNSNTSTSSEFNGYRLNIVSHQSNARPSCVLSLDQIADSKCVWQRAELIHIFPANAIENLTQEVSSTKVYYLVLVEKSVTFDHQSSIHMWKITINYPDDDKESFNFNQWTNKNEWLVQVQSSKVCTYVLPLSADAELQSVDVAFGHLSSSTLCFSDSSSSSPYLLSTSHADGTVRFWTCIHQSSDNYQWSEWCGVTTDRQVYSQLKLPGPCLALSNAYCARLAVAFREQEQIRIGIYECESTGGTMFQCESRFTLVDLTNSVPPSSIHFDWASIENGAHILATSVGVRYIFIYSYTQTNQWTKIRKIELAPINGNMFLGPNLSLKWVRGGLLLVGLNSELQVYSQWSSIKRRSHAIKPEPLIMPKRRINTSTNLKRLANGTTESNTLTTDETKRKDSSPSWLTLDSIDSLSLFHAARNAAPVLPQYHPTVLLELVRFGKYRRVKAILAHLTRCIVSTVHSVEGRVEMRLMRSRTFSIANNDDNEPSIAEVESMKYVEIDTIPLLPLFALLDSDHEIPTNTINERTSNDVRPQDEQTEQNTDDLDNKYSDLFTSPDHNREVDFRFDEDQVQDAERIRQIELNKFRRELQSNRNWSPAFDSRMVDLLVDYFQRVRLGNLTSLEQMYLLALADTLANSSGGSLTGQVVTGSKPSNTMDDCGLRFLIDVQRYIYLSRIASSPSVQGVPLKQIITSASYAWAFHSDSQEDLLATLPCMAKNKPNWNELELFGVGWWIRNKSVIARLFERLGKSAFEAKNDPLDGALYFLALKKKNLLYNLYKHVQDVRMQEFFKNDFNEERWSMAAQKNAFALLGKQRFHHAAAFFLLAGKVRDAVQVIINNLNDIQLALLVARLHDDDEQSLVTRILNEQILAKAHSDPFYRSMAYWLLKDYETSVTTLLNNEKFDQQQSVLILYDYLKQHPLVLRAKQFKTTHQQANTFEIERRAHFQTAYYYLKMGCPLLALEILAKLPSTISMPSETCSTVTNSVSTKTVEVAADAFDWGQSLRQPLVKDELKLDWSDGEKDEDNDTAEKQDEPTVVQTTSNEKSCEKQLVDTIGQYLKLICCLKIVVEEMATLATGFEVTGGQLRHHLACWLQQEIGIIRNLCNLKSSENNVDDDSRENLDEPFLSDLYDDDLSPQNCFTGVDSSPTSSFVRANQIESKMKRLSRRRRWLKANEHLLQTLISFTSLHGMHGGGLASVRMELLLFLHELYRERQTQLKNPIPYPTQVPLLIANLSGLLSVSNNAISYIRDLNHDLLRTMNYWLTLPKLTEHSMQIVAIRDLSIALSSCVYQSLCNTKENQTSERIAVESFLKSYLYRRESIRLHRRTSVSALIEQEAPTTAPKDWPGIKISINQNKDPETNIVKLKLLLVEILISVYMSLLIYALSTDDCNTLYRLLKRKWSTSDSAVKLWYGVFGGGAKKPMAQRTNPSNFGASSVDSNGENLSSSADRRVLGSSLARRIFTTNNQQNQTLYSEVFIPPRASIVNFFMAKISADKDASIDDNDGEISDADDEQQENQENDDDFNENQNLTEEQKQKKAQEREHADSTSYSWALMRFTIVQVIYKRLLAFFPHIGIEKHEIPSVSPLIQKLLQNLHIWQDSLRRTLEDFHHAPENYLPLMKDLGDDEKCNVTLNQRNALIIEPTNTPFANVKSALPAKRLWICLANDDQAKGILMKYIFKRRKPTKKVSATPVETVRPISKKIVKLQKKSLRRASSHITLESTESRVLLDSTDNNSSSSNVVPSKIIYRDSEGIYSFCLNNNNPTLLAAGLSREIIELDIRSITLINEKNDFSDDENDSPPLNSQPAKSNSNSTQRENHQERVTSLRMPTMGGYVPNVYLTQTSFSGANGNSSNNENQQVLVNRHAVREARKFANHPVLPDYLTGCSDGSVFLLNWSRESTPRQVREAGRRVTKIDFSSDGNKFGVADVDGNLSLHVLSTTRSTAYLRLLAHNKGTNDFVFLDSSTILATSGASTDHQNIALWDSLMAPSRANITSFTCHESGNNAGQCLVYSPANQILISGGKRGDIAIFDIRQRKRLATSQAHDSNLRALCLDPLEKFYVTGSNEGNIRVWRLHGCEPVHCFYNEHSRRGFLHAQVSGVNHLQLTSNRQLFSAGLDGTISVRSIAQFD